MGIGAGLGLLTSAPGFRSPGRKGGTAVPTFSSSTFGKYTGACLIGTAIFELLLSLGFLYMGVIQGISGMTLTGVILGVLGVGLLIFGIGSRRKAAESQRIDETGLAGTGQIVGM